MLLLIFLLALHDPSTRLLSMLLSLLLRAHNLLQLELVGNVDALLYSRTCVDDIQPPFNLGERLGLNASPSTPVDPGEAGNICNAELVAVGQDGRSGLGIDAWSRFGSG
jgi:hypothetical protein